MMINNSPGPILVQCRYYGQNEFNLGHGLVSSNKSLWFILINVQKAKLPATIGHGMQSV